MGGYLALKKCSRGVLLDLAHNFAYLYDASGVRLNSSHFLKDTPCNATCIQFAAASKNILLSSSTSFVNAFVVRLLSVIDCQSGLSNEEGEEEPQVRGRKRKA